MASNGYRGYRYKTGVEINATTDALLVGNMRTMHTHARTHARTHASSRLTSRQSSLSLSLYMYIFCVSIPTATLRTKFLDRVTRNPARLLFSVPAPTRSRSRSRSRFRYPNNGGAVSGNSGERLVGEEKEKSSEESGLGMRSRTYRRRRRRVENVL